ncbi:MAG: GPP34 family phosphoprotein [Rhodanobacteraceae bacterium]|nr:GPP34 family phosphoprotein [Rhodanobacteraceae bacterium]MBK7043174.1 GPP34 family phosphoprotein [Rhodanobacteraceae bacterium]MBP9154539.1 GPP34 family phosphoprotein [Xanthomonadales bacterium]HQW80280.1 GPP34 family phosphoprotein [Pseudomonadota bacterium]
MILAERLCLFSFDPHDGRERVVPDRDVLHVAIAGLMLVDLIRSGRFAITVGHVEQRDTMPLAHPLLTEAATLLSRLHSTTLTLTLRQLRAASPRWRQRMHKTLAERAILELQIPFPFMRRYRLRSRQAWIESAQLLDTTATTAHSGTIALSLAIDRCGWLADTVSSGNARQLLMRIDEAIRSDDPLMRQLPDLFAQR